jgi:transcriptional regulator with XRE-family HTH domain
MDITKKFGERIRQIRKQQKMSQNELAEKSALHRTYIGAVERGD